MFNNSARWLSGRWSKVLGAGLVMLLAVLSLAAPAAAQAPVPFKGTLQATESGVFNPGPPPTVSVTAAGSGNATQLGHFAYSYTVVIHLNPDLSGTGTLYYDFVAANGDHLYSVGQGFGDAAEGIPNTNHVVEQHVITGGTGRFAGATGSFTVDRLISNVTSITTGTIDGTIVLAPGH
jgi:hypothetical protein